MAQSMLMQELARQGISRREFLGFCTSMATVLGLPKAASGAIAAAVESDQRPVLVWLEFQDCAGNTESFLRAGHPTVADLILDTISLNYHETLMAAAGSQAESALADTVRTHSGQYIALVEGSIPGEADSGFCTIGGRSALDIAREVCGQAMATIAVGTCATFGGIPAARPNPTRALSVGDAVPGVRNLINMSACPANADNIVALLVYYLTVKQWPPLDQYRRPLFAYGTSIHDACERRAHFDAGQYVEAWGDEAHRHGHCLYKMGCKGPATSQNCPNVQWNGGTNWPIGCGHPCIGCAEPNFWDVMTPFYERLPDVAGVDTGRLLDPVGLAATGAVAAGVVVHGVSEVIRYRRGHRPSIDDVAAGAKGKSTGGAMREESGGPEGNAPKGNRPEGNGPGERKS
ncbi:MAG TPA: hydrogenase small subunit [Steroidobacteraceae bacterium]|nr:hydrogenase small subunit [Steroidobacteraceae bacterium]